MNAKTLDKVLKLKRKIEVLASDLRSGEPLVSLHLGRAAEQLDRALIVDNEEKRR